MDTVTVKQIVDLNDIKLGSISSFCFDGKGNRTVMSMESCCHVIFTDYLAPMHRRQSKLEVFGIHSGTHQLHQHCQNRSRWPRSSKRRPVKQDHILELSRRNQD